MIQPRKYQDVGIERPAPIQNTEPNIYTPTIKTFVNEKFIPIVRPPQPEQPVNIRQEIETPEYKPPPVLLKYDTTHLYKPRDVVPEPTLQSVIQAPTTNVVGIQPRTTYSAYRPIYEEAGNVQPITNWYLYPTLNGTVKFIDDIGEHNLQSIDGNLYFDNELLAKANDIQDIADWSLYPALSTIVMENQDISGAGAISGASLQIAGDISSSTIHCSTLTALSDISSSTIHCSTLTATGDISTALQVNCSHLNILGTAPKTSTEIFEGVITNGSDIINQGDISTITLNVSSSANVGSLEVTGLAQVKSLNLFDGTAPCALTTDALGSNLFVNGNVVQTGSPADASLWATFPAVSTINCAGFDIDDAGSIIAGGITESIDFGRALVPMLQHNLYALQTTIQTTSPLNTMTLQSAGGMNINTGAGDLNITSITGDINVTCPDFNVTMTDPTSFMNLTAPGGITIAGGGIFMASGVLECVIPGDITLVSAGNVSIGSGNVLGANTEVEKFAFDDNVLSAIDGIQFLRLHNIQSIDNEIRSGLGGDGRLDLACLQQQITTVTSGSDSSKTTTTTTDANNRLFSIVNNTDPVTLGLGTNSNVFTTTFYGASSVVYGTTGGTVNMSGITDISTSTVHCGSITATGDISSSTIHCSTLTATSDISSSTIHCSTITNNTMVIGGTTVNNNAFTLSTIGSPSTTALTPSLQGKTYLLSGSPQNFTTAGLGAGDAGFFVYVKNGSALNINVEENGVAIGGTPILYAATVIANASLALIWWDGATLRMN